MHVQSVLVSPGSQSAVLVWEITLFFSVFCLSPFLSVLCCVAKMRSPAECSTYFWRMWSLERRSRINASLRWRETPKRCGQWEGLWGRTRWVWLTLIDKADFCLYCLDFTHLFYFIIFFLQKTVLFFLFFVLVMHQWFSNWGPWTPRDQRAGGWGFAIYLFIYYCFIST